MPRAKADEMKSDNGSTKVMTTIVGQPGDAADKPVDYEIPSNADVFQKFVASLTAESLTQGYADYCEGLRKRIRQDAYDAAASESTWITVGKDAQGNAVRKDIMTFPVANFIKSYNFQWGGLSSKAEMLSLGGPTVTVDDIDRGFGAWRAAARRHAAEGRLKMADDGTVAVV